MLKKILAVSGKPGLFRLISQGRNTLVVESLVDQKRFTIHAADKVVSLADISMYTIEEDMPLSEVLTRLYARQAGQPVDLSALKDQDALRAAFGEVVETFDRERVYTTDIKKLFSWYNILLTAGITNYQEETAEVVEQ